MKYLKNNFYLIKRKYFSYSKDTVQKKQTRLKENSEYAMKLKNKTIN